MSSDGTGWYAYAPMSGATYSGPDPTGPRRRDERPELADVGRLLRRGVSGLVGAARAGQRTSLGDLLHGHLGVGLDALDVVEDSWAAYEHVNVQAGLDAWTGQDVRAVEVVGVIGYQHRQFGLADALEEAGAPHDPMGPRPGNVARVNLAAGPAGEVLACVRCAVFLVTEGERRTALLLRGPEPHSGSPTVVLQAVSSEPGGAAAAVHQVRELATEHNVFRHQVLSFGGEVFGHGETLMQFHPRPSVTSDQVVLDPAVLAAVHRQVVELGRHKERLLDAGQHLKRGLLLYGPPGVGKTHLVRHLTSTLTGTTVVQLTGDALHLIAEACSVARSLQPAMLVVEDVDLIAEDRGMHPGQHPLLFQLLNEMDGLAEDADVVFVLTTNRADLLEPALAARPGRVDQAVELALPDADARRALVELYRGPMQVDTSRFDELIERTEGVTASFLKELLRRSALFAAERDAEGGALAVTADDLEAALEELLDTRNAMTRALLGGARVTTAADDDEGWES